jgi:prephenate dehydratase
MKVAYCGRIGSFSHEASLNMFPNSQYIAFNTFQQAIESVHNDFANYAVIPIENSTAGRVAEIHNILPEMNLLITKEIILPILHNIYTISPQITLDAIEFVESHPQALMQCSKFLSNLKVEQNPSLNTAIAAENLAISKKNNTAVICSQIAGNYYNLHLAGKSIQNNANNFTTFIAVGKKPLEKLQFNEEFKPITCIIFTIDNKTGGIYNALGCFAKNGVNLLKLESYISTGTGINKAQFFVIFEGSNDSDNVLKSLNELSKHTIEIRNFGSYNADCKRFF